MKSKNTCYDGRKKCGAAFMHDKKGTKLFECTAIKSILLFLLSVSFLFPLFSVNSFAANYAIGVYIDGVTQDFDISPAIVNGRTMVPMRAIFEALGASVEWIGESSTIIAVKDDTTVKMQIDSDIMYKNGEAVKLDIVPFVSSARTLVPVRAVAESFNADVTWNETMNSVVIETGADKVKRFEDYPMFPDFAQDDPAIKMTSEKVGNVKKYHYSTEGNSGFENNLINAINKYSSGMKKYGKLLGDDFKPDGTMVTTYIDNSYNYFMRISSDIPAQIYDIEIEPVACIFDITSFIFVPESKVKQTAGLPESMPIEQMLMSGYSDQARILALLPESAKNIFDETPVYDRSTTYEMVEVLSIAPYASDKLEKVVLDGVECYKSKAMAKIKVRDQLFDIHASSATLLEFNESKPGPVERTTMYSKDFHIKKVVSSEVEEHLDSGWSTEYPYYGVTYWARSSFLPVGGSYSNWNEIILQWFDDTNIVYDENYEAQIQNIYFTFNGEQYSAPVVGFITNLENGSIVKEKPAEVNPQPGIGTEGTKITLAEFNSIETGMTYEEVVEIIGGEGTLTSEASVGGYTSKIYTWKGEGSYGANASIGFMNGRVQTKAQVGLK